MKKVSIAKITVTSGATPTLEIKVDGRLVRIPVSSALKTNFQNQFSRPAPTSLQKKKYQTVMALMVAAYKAGMEDAP